MGFGQPMEPSFPRCPECLQARWPVGERRDGFTCCDECANRRGTAVLGHPADRLSTVRQTQVWVLHPDGRLVRHSLTEGAVRIAVKGEWWPVWHVVGRLGEEFPPLVYANQQPSAKDAARVMNDMRDRWKDEPSLFGGGRPWDGTASTQPGNG